jgi:putative photosynthetic complex assembly protein 2
MIAYGLPILATLALWWVSTGVILHLDSLDRRTFGRSMVGASVILVLSLWFTRQSSSQTTPGSAYLAFACGLVTWGWQLLSFYTGFVTGPRKAACSPDCRGFSRFIEALRTSLHHELSAVLGALALLALTHGQPNRVALWTYLILWWMHESAKLNAFFGVLNLGEDMLPSHLAYLASFMRRRPMNLLFPISVTVSTIAATLLFQHAVRTDASAFETTSDTMLAALMALAVAEHWFLVVPIDANEIWRSFRRQPAADELGAARRRVERELEGARAPALAGTAANSEQLQSSESWSACLPAVCDARNVAQVLDLVAAGSFGEVESVQGLARTTADWVCFEASKGRAWMEAFAPQRLQEPLMIARGRRFDRARLQAALDGCAALV